MAETVAELPPEAHGEEPEPAEPTEQQEEGEGEEGEEDDLDAPDPEELHAALGGVASGLAEQLTTITQEVSKIREELYGDNGIGGIAQELEKMKAGSLGGLGLGGLDGLEGLLDDADLAPERDLGDGLRRRPQEAKPGGKGGKGARGVKGGKGGGRGTAFNLEREQKLEELRQRIEDRHAKDQKKDSLGFMEWLVILFVIFVIAYTALPSFRSQVKRTFLELAFGEAPEMEEVPDFGAVVEEDMDSFF